MVQLVRLGLAMLLAFQVALTPETFGWPCPEDDEGTCEVGCTDCASCGHSALGDVVDARTEAALDTPKVAERPQCAPQPPDPADILHVPIVRSA